MENQEKEFIHEAAKKIMDLVLKENMQTFCILTKEGTTQHSLCTVACGNPFDLIIALIKTMDQNTDIYKIIKSAVVAFESKKGFMEADSPIDSADLLKDSFSKIFNG